MKNKKILVMMIGIVLILFGVNFISAEFWACFEKGEVVHYCGGYKPDWTCDSNSGCEKCISVYREAEDCYVHGVWAVCNQQGQECNNYGNTTLDIEPPIINLSSPINEKVYNEKGVYISGESNEIADWYYKDSSNLWRKFCTQTRICNKEISFAEGENNIQIKAVDVVGNEAEKESSFFVDSKKPIIYKALPKKGFADGNFEVQFKEENPASLILHYGDKTRNINLEDCRKEKGKTYCDNFADLEEFDGEEINYRYVLTDAAGNVAESKPITLSVDTTSPVINNLDSFWTQNGKYIYFNMSITENNFDEANYNYVDSRGRVKEVKLCSALKNNLCTVKKTFTRGHYDLTINVLDDAGNSIGVPINFNVDY